MKMYLLGHTKCEIETIKWFSTFCVRKGNRDQLGILYYELVLIFFRMSPMVIDPKRNESG